ncbi:MAG: hypothetical protein RJA02_1306, partial [Armatimonadota bacterium]
MNDQASNGEETDTPPVLLGQAPDYKEVHHDACRTQPERQQRQRDDGDG